MGSLLAKKNTILDCGNSGNFARLLIGILSTTPNINIKITGDESLKKEICKTFNLMNKFGASFDKNKSYLTN